MASPSLPGGQLGAWQTEDTPLWAGTDLPEQGAESRWHSPPAGGPSLCVGPGLASLLPSRAAQAETLRGPQALCARSMGTIADILGRPA